MSNKSNPIYITATLILRADGNLEVKTYIAKAVSSGAVSTLLCGMFDRAGHVYRQDSIKMEKSEYSRPKIGWR